MSLEIKFCDFSAEQDLTNLIAAQNEVYRQRGLKFTEKDFRYWYAESVKDIARRFSVTENNVSVTLNRLRSQLKEHLKGKGYDI